ncbi:MAG: IPT/TIG domain-containing protein [Acidobacteriota bacterium]
MRTRFIALALAACGSHHAAKAKDATTIDAPQCVVDTDCANARCCSSVCVQTSDCAFSVTHVDPAEGFINGGAYLTLTGSGFAKGMQVFIADGRAPVSVTSPTSARIVTPPGPFGLQDVKIQLAGTAAVLPAAFDYRTAGLEMTWEQKPLQVVRGEDPALAVLQDGRVLVAGGTTVPDSAANALDTAEIYDPTTDLVTPAANKMSTPRWHDGAITLLSGKVLVVGSTCGDPATCPGDGTLADLFDPTTNTFTPTSHKLNRPRYYVRAALMPDGRVFISSMNDATIEIYDPDTDSFLLLDHAQTHVFGFAVRLRDGRILLGGGDGGTRAAELFDFDSDTITPANPLVQGRSMLTAHVLPSGKVAVIGGASSSAGGIMDPMASIELFDPATATFTTAGYQLATPRCWHASALVRDGTMLVMGGYTVSMQCNSSVASVEQIDPVAGTVTAFPTLPNTNTEWTAVTMLDGSIVGVGGGACGTTMALPDIDFLKGAPIQ